jgi:hemerythrin-like domain-containing protein
MKTTDILMNEHQIILKNLDELKILLDEKLIEKIHSIENKIKFIQVYADHFHHAKEEDIYFPWMKSKNSDLEHGPLHCMLDEHDQGRAMVQLASLKLEEYKKTKNENALTEVKNTLLPFIYLLQSHIHKEDEILYRIAEQLNDHFGDGDSQMLAQFLEVGEKYQGTLQEFSNL